ncbi:MAG TPA: hypothetical protein DCM05_00160 [Elusimicrobia bacterium]|nr:hypothetical protein [Elusimicrobiota bacterium]
MTLKIDPLNEPVSRMPQLECLSVAESTSFGKALGLMRQANAGSVLVCKSKRLLGWLTQRRILEKFAIERVSPKTPVGKLMARDPVTIGPETTVGQAAGLMRRKDLRGLPVVDAKGLLLGLVTAGRIVRFVAANYPLEIMNLPPEPRRLAEEVEGA